MSQVKKLQVGGKFIIDGQEINGDDAINAVRSYLGETTGGIMNALKEGQIVDYNSADNTISITDNKGQSLTNNYLPAGTKASTMDSRFKKDWGATFHTKTDQFKRELARLRGVSGFKSKATEEVPNLTQLRKGSGWFYTKDSNGNDIFEEGPLNKDRLAVLSEFRDYVQHYGDFGEDESKKKYKTEGWNADNLRALQNYFKDVKTDDDRNNYWSGLLGRIKDNKLENTDKELLRLMGFDDGAISGESGNGSGNGNQNSGYAIDPNWKGDKDALKQRGLGIKRTPDGRWQLIGDADNQFLTNNWWTNGLDFLPEDMQKGFFLNNGIWYSENEVYNNPKFVSQVGGWYGANRDNWNNWYNDVNNSGIRFVNDRIWDNGDSDYYGVFGQTFNPQEEYNQYLTPYFRKAGINGPISVADITNQFQNLNDGSRVFAYLNPTSAFNGYGIPTISYVRYNPNGEVKYSDDLSGLTRNLYGSTSDILTSNYINGRELGNGRNRRRFALHSELNIPGSDNSILADEEGNLYLGKWNQSAGNLRGHRITNMDLLNEILANPNDPKWKNINLEDLYKTVIVDPNVNAPSKKKGLERLKENAHTSFNWNYDVYRKQGGTLPKLQFGGPIKNTTTTKTQKKTEESKTDIVKPHKLDGSDGKLDSWEKMQIAAAIGDAIGVGLSFGGVAGGVAGAATGVASTGTRFAADVKKDGLDWGDVKRGAINLGFDLAALPASLIPGADNAIKAAKLARTVKSIGQPVLKWLGTIGATTSTINIAKKWINGESPTSQDLSAFISGIGAGAVAGKQWSKQLGASKLAANRSSALANTQNASIPKSVEAPIATGKTLKYETKELSDLISKNSGKQKPVIDKIIADASHQGVTLTEKGAEEALKTMGVNIGEKGKLNFWVRKNGKWVAPWGRGETTVSFNPQQPTQGKSTLEYFFRPILRQRALGYLKPTTKQGNLLDTIAPEEYTNILNSGSFRDHTISGALRRRGFESPEAFNFEFSPNATSVRIPWQFGWRGYVRMPQVWKSKQPEVFDALPGTMGYHLPLIKESPEVLARRARIKNYIRPFRQEYSDPALWQATMMGSYKQGGKIIKAQNGTKTNRPQLIPLVDKSTLYDSLAHLENLDNLRAQESINKTLSNTGTSIRQDYINNNYKSPEISIKTNGSNNRTGGLWGNEWLINKPNLDDAIRAGITARAIYHDRDLQRIALGKLYQRQFQTPQFDRAKYNYSDIEQGYNESTKPYLESRFVTSDARDSMAFKLNKAQQLSGLAGQKNAQLTQRFNQIGDINRQIDAQNETNRIQTANEKSQYLTNLNYQDAMLDSVTWNRLFSDVINPFGQQMSQQGRDAWNKNLSGQYQFDAQNFQRQEAARIKGALNNKYTSDWNKLSEDQRKQYGDIETYAYTVDPEGYNEIINGNEIYRGQMWDLMRKYSRAAGAGLFYKSGGTINIKNTNKNLRPAQEQIAINSAKSAKRSVDELSKALLKMLAQLTK